MVAAWLKAGVVDRGRFAPTEEGAPQGGVITPPTHWATLSLRWLWAIGGWNGLGVSSGRS